MSLSIQSSRCILPLSSGALSTQKQDSIILRMKSTHFRFDCSIYLILLGHSIFKKKAITEINRVRPFPLFPFTLHRNRLSIFIVFPIRHPPATQSLPSSHVVLFASKIHFLKCSLPWEFLKGVRMEFEDISPRFPENFDPPLQGFPSDSAVELSHC